ncbi:MAG: hypothetical protein ACRELG_10275 [Gemmataceae bacterium]
MSVEWPYPWSPIEFPDDKPAFESELQRELKPGHPLFGIPVSAIGRRYDQDDILFELRDGRGRVAEVHLTWAGESETPPWPGASLFESFTAWVESVKEEYP